MVQVGVDYVDPRWGQPREGSTPFTRTKLVTSGFALNGVEPLCLFWLVEVPKSNGIANA
jgi:hypothetical protein